MNKRTQADREFDWETGRELERKDAKVDHLKNLLKAARKHVDPIAQPYLADAIEKALEDR